MNAPSHDPEERWRRTVQQRRRPLKLKVGRLLREFGVSELEYGVAESIEARLAQVGVTVWPSLVDADDDDVITLDMAAEAGAAPAAPPPADGAPVVELPFAGARARQPPPPADGRFAPRTEPRFAPRTQPHGDPRPAPSLPAQPGVPQIEHSPLVRAAVEAERRVRSAYDQAASAAEERIARLERELAVEREAISRTRDERDQLEQRMHAERRQAAARLQALAAAERTALRLLEAERAQLTDRAQAEFGADSERAAQRAAFDDASESPRARIRDADKAPSARIETSDGSSVPGENPVDEAEPFHDLVDEPDEERSMMPPSWAVTELEATTPKAPKPPWRPSRPGRPGRPGRPSLPRRMPRATFRPAPTWAPPRSGGHRTRIALVPLVLALGAVGYLLGHGNDESAATPAATPLVQQASSSGVSLRYPAGWVQRSDDPKIDGLRFSRPLAVSASRDSPAVIVAGVVQNAVGSDLLPASLRRRLADSAPPAEPVLLGDVQALRYAGVRPEGDAGELTLFATPTTDGSVIVVCRGPAGGGEFADVCERSAVTLRLEGLTSERLDGRRALTLGPSPAYGRRVAAAISAIEVAQTIDGERLRKASDAAAQATAADAIATTFARAAGDLDSGPVSARDREGHAGLVRAMRAAADAYAALAGAARDGRRADYATAAGAVTDADARLRRAIGALQTLGYT